jgi:hypothetical protein
MSLNELPTKDEFMEQLPEEIIQTEEDIYNERKAFLINRILNYFKHPPANYTEYTLDIRFLRDEDKVEINNALIAKGYQFCVENGLARLC